MAAKQKVTLPSHIHGHGLSWRVRRRSTLRRGGETLFGLCDPIHQTIYINTTACGTVERTRRTLIHEALHALLEDHPQYDDEALINLLEGTVDELVRLNPGILALYGYARATEEAE